MHASESTQNFLHDKELDDADEDGDRLRWGWRKYKPQNLQIFNSDQWFTFFIVMFNIFQLTNGVYTSASISTLEKKFQLSSKKTGFIISANDISGLILLPFVSYFGETRHKPKWLGIGSLISALGGLMFILPQAFVGRHIPTQLDESTTGNGTLLCLLEGTDDDSTRCGERKVVDDTVIYLIFILGRLLMGVGSTPVLSLGMSFIDDNANPKYSAIYIGLLISSIFLGLGLGNLLQGFLLGEVFIDVTLPEELEGITSRHPHWIGNWWIGYVFSAIMLLFSGIMLLGFPRELPGTQERKQMMMDKGELRPTDKKIKVGIKGIFFVFFKLLTNPIYITQTLGKLMVTAFWSGVGPFIFKILQQNYGSTPQDTGLALFFVAGPGLVIGTMLGSYMSKRFHLNKSLQKAAKWCCFLQIPACFLTFVYLTPGCDNIVLAGVTSPYYNRSLPVPENILSTCNSACSCNSDYYDPVCGTDDVTYYSPCHAGCTSTVDEKMFTNCSCISPSLPQTAQQGICDRGCKNFVLMSTLYALLAIMGPLNNIPGQIVLLRSVPENYRSFGIGLQPIFTKILGNLPGPLIVGGFIDDACLLWLTSCGKRGNCLEYKIKDVVLFVVIGGTLVQVLSFTFLVISWLLTNRIKDEQSEKTKEFIQLSDNEHGNEVRTTRRFTF